jgi:hypothetical protein
VNGFSYGCQMKNPSQLLCIENVEEPLMLREGQFLAGQYRRGKPEACQK